MSVTKKVLLAAVIGILIISSPIFEIREIKIEGNSALSREKILETTGIQIGKNIFYFNHFKAKKTLSELPYTAEAKISYSYPSKVMIEITERTVQSYVLFEPTNSFLLIDENGRVLEVLTYMPEKLPVITGLKIAGFTTGEIIDAENVEELDNAVVLSQLFTKYEIDDLIKVDVSNKEDIKLYVGSMIIKFGQIESADVKIRNLKQIVLNFDTSSRGTLDISDTSKDPIFKYLT